MGQTRQFGDAGSMSGLRESGHGYKTARWQRLRKFQLIQASAVQVLFGAQNRDGGECGRSRRAA
jgi:hypothetical protein